MKYLIFTLFLLISSSTLFAQDTLYVKGQRKPLIVTITIVKKNSLNYTEFEGGLIHTIKMKNVKKIRFQKDTETTGSQAAETAPSPSPSPSPSPREVKVYSDFDEFRSTISANSIGSLRNYSGLNYLYHLKNIKLKNERANFLINMGGGFYNRTPTFFLNGSGSNGKAEGYYLEFGFRMESESRRNPKNRFHIGLDINNRWVEKTISNIFNPTEIRSNETEFAIQVPVGYTFRSPKGFFLNTGLELTTEKLFPAIHIGLGISFGQ